MNVARIIQRFCSWRVWDRVGSHLLMLAILVLLAVICWASAGCASTGSLPAVPKTDRPVNGPSTKLAPAATPEGRRVQEAQAKVDALERDLAAAKADVVAADQAKVRAEREASVATLRAWCLWLSVGCLLAAAACVALAIFLPAGKKLALTGAAAAAAVLILLQCVSLALGYLVWIAAGVGVCVLIAIAWALAKNRQVIGELTRFGTDAATVVRTSLPSQWDRMKEDAITRQTKAGLQSTIDRVVAPFKPKPAVPIAVDGG